MNYRKDWMTDDQWRCWELLADLYRGFHHLQGKVKPAGPSGIEFNTANHSMATYDFDQLTRAVILAHERCIRFEITSSGPRMLRFYLHQRKRSGRAYERHPTIHQVLEPSS